MKKRWRFKWLSI